MVIPFSLILDILGDCKPELIGNTQIGGGFNWVEILSEGEPFESEQIVYVTTPDHTFKDGIPKGHVCISPSKKKDIKALKNVDGLIINLGKSLSPCEIVKRIREYILSIQAWESAMADAILKKDLGQLFSCSEKILGNSVLFFTQQYKLLDYIGDIPWGNSAYSIYLNDIDKSDTISLPNPTSKKSSVGKHDAAKNAELQNYPFIKRTIEVERHPINYLVMLCNHFHPTEGRTALFDYFAERLKVFISIDTPTDSFEHSVESFILDLIENKITDPHAIANRATFCKVSMEKLFCLFVVRFDTYNEIKTIRLMKNLNFLLPDSRLLIYYDKILIINYFPECVKYQQILGWVDKIKDLLRENNAELGISQSERSIDKLSRAYTSAIKALHYGRRIRDHRITEPFDDKDINQFQGYDIYMYENYYIYHMIDLVSNQNSLIFENSYCIQALIRLHSLDKARNLDNVRLLYCYLANGGSAAKTATQLHMHRNNVVYRIKRIEEFLGMDLVENHHLSFKFMFAYRILDFYGIDYLESTEPVLLG